MSKKYKTELTSKKMLLLTMGSNDHASSRVRAIQFIPFLTANSNFIIKWIPRIPNKPNSKLDKWIYFPLNKRYFTFLRFFYLLFKKWDILFVQKIFLPNWILKITQKRGTFILFDFDDAIFINRDGKYTNETETVRMIKSASKVVVSTKELVPFCEKYDVKAEIITSSVDAEKIVPINKPDLDIVTIGWMGSYWTTDFLKSVYKPLLTLSKNHDFQFLVVGAKPGLAMDGINMIKKTWTLENEPRLLNDMDIGIMPLPDSEYAKAKGGFKLFLYMAAGLPVVASPVGINSSIVEHGKMGYLAKNQEEWIEYLSRLIAGKKLRKEMGSYGRKILTRKYDLKVNAQKLLSIINEA